MEQDRGFFVVEGQLAAERLVDSPYPPVSLLVAANKQGRTDTTALAAALEARGAELLVAEQEIINQTVGFRLHRGVVALARRAVQPSVAELIGDGLSSHGCGLSRSSDGLSRTARDLPAGPRMLAVLEGVNDHENLGAIFRNARALGVHGVLLDPTTADPLYRRTVRVSMGNVLQLAWSRSTNWPGDLVALRSAGYRLLALSPRPEAHPLKAVELPSGPDAAVAVMVGAEGPGLSPLAMEAADLVVRIEMRPQADSLNVATAAALAWYTLGRRLGIATS